MTDSPDIALPADTRPSRLAVRPGDNRPVSDFDPDDIARVDDRVAEFREAYPDGRIVTKIRSIFHHPNTGEPPTFVARTKVWRIAGGYVASTGTASRTQGEGDFPYSERALEVAESVSITRALRFLGIEGTPS